ncbi:hypothetical protein ACET3Z_016834 [Daucus carota]
MASGGVAKELTSKEAEIQKMLTAEVHLGTKNCDFQMERRWYLYYQFGQHGISFRWQPESLLPSRSPRTLLSSLPGLMTSFSEPRLLILTDPRTDHQPIKEAALGNILTIAFCDMDSPMRYVDIGPKWEVMVDLFFYREPEEAKEEEEEAALADYADYSAPALGGTDHWSSQFPDAQWKNEGVQAAIPDVPGATGWTADAEEVRGTKKAIWDNYSSPVLTQSTLDLTSSLSIVHQVPEGHVGVNWKGGALLKIITDPGLIHCRIQCIQVLVQSTSDLTSSLSIVHQVAEGHVRVYWKSGALLKTIIDPAQYDMEMDIDKTAGNGNKEERNKRRREAYRKGIEIESDEQRDICICPYPSEDNHYLPDGYPVKPEQIHDYTCLKCSERNVKNDIPSKIWQQKKGGGSAAETDVIRKKGRNELTEDQIKERQKCPRAMRLNKEYL